MADKPIFVFNNLDISAGDMSGSLTSTTENISEIDLVAVQAVWSAGSSPVGTLTLEGSVDNTTFTTIGTSSIAVSGNSGSALYNVTDPAYEYIRAVYTRTSGSGTLNVRIAGKVR